MNLKYIISLMFVFLLGVLLIGHGWLSKDASISYNLLAFNDTTELATENWSALTKEEPIAFPATQTPYVIINLKGQILYASEADYPSDYLTGDYASKLWGAIAHQDTLLDIMVEDTLVGKVIFINTGKTFKAQKQSLFYTLSLGTICLFIGQLLYLFYINRTILRPFKNLKAFASRVAKGDLELPPEMDKHNIFGAFTESFSIMTDELKKAKKQEYLANLSKKELIASLSHDIKTPLASIKAISEVLSLTVNSDKEKEKVQIIYDKTNQIEKLINDMFHSTLEELHELHVAPTSQPSTLIITLLENADYENLLTLKNACPSCLLLIDPLRLGQVLDNIFHNSYKYAHTPIEVSFTLNGAYLSLFIKDFGTGLEEEELAFIFNKFFRGKNSGQQSGCGLGLYLAKYFMEHMQGQIEAYNEADGFVVRLDIGLV